MQITVIGTGYVGLVTGACFAESGNDVVALDIDSARIELLNGGGVPIYEPGLTEMIERNRRGGRLTFTTDSAQAIRQGDFHFICVGTPSLPDGSTDLSAVRSVARDIGRHLERPAIVVTKSTVPVGTSDEVETIIQGELRERGDSIPFHVVNNPEFLKEGAAIDDFMKPDRIVLGSESPAAIEQMRDLYAPFNRNHNKLLVMDRRSSEFTKYAANALLATKISFVNEMANIAERVGVNIEQVRFGIGSDPRIGYDFIYPGAGYGGSCFPKDVRSLERVAASAGYDARLVRAVEDVNEFQKNVLFNKINSFLGGNLQGRTIAVWGLAFKPRTDDMRDAPSRALMEAIWTAGGNVRAFDPEASAEAARLYPGKIESGQLVLCSAPEEALRDADVLAICTEWRVFQSVDFEDLRTLLKQPVVFDGRNIYDPLRMTREGIRYFGIGLGNDSIWQK